MRIAVCSDSHGGKLHLERFIEYCRRENIEQVCHLGDVVEDARCLRENLDIENLWGFHEEYLEEQPEYLYCRVIFGEGQKSYYYIADDESISVGDYVIVPVGKDNHHSAAEVVKVEYFAEEDVPLPLDRTKHIIRKCTDGDFDPPNKE